MMDPLKDAFSKIKNDVGSMKHDIELLKQDIKETKETMIDLCDIIKKINEKTTENTQKTTTTQEIQIPTTLTHSSTNQHTFKLLKTQNLGISTGNQGVPTDRQTNQQTDRQAYFEPKTTEKPPENNIDNAAEILDSLDNIKREIRLKFKRLTDQEILIFSTLYQFDEEQGYSDYASLAKKLNLTESSIRDYVGRLIKKGIPVEKKKINNKNIHLSVSQNLKKIASLATILKLRDL